MTEDELTSAFAQRPGDAAAIAVYGDWLADRGEPLGEYIAVCTKLDQIEEPYERIALVAHRHRLREAHERAWLARWNQPLALFDATTNRFCGLPCSVVLEQPPVELAAFERQIASLPIQNLRVTMPDVAQIAQLEPLSLLRRITSLTFLPHYPQRLDRDVVRWVADRALANLTWLSLFSADLRTGDVRRALDALPGLESVGLYRAGTTAELAGELATSSATPRLRYMSLSDTPIGNEVAAALSAWTALQHVDLARTGLDDSIARLPVIELPITSVDLSGNTLGPEAIAWVGRSMPKLEEIVLPAALSPAAIAELAPIAHRLESITIAYGGERSAIEAIAGMIPRLPALRRLDLSGDSIGLVRDILAAPLLESLAVRGATDADLAELAVTQRKLGHLDVEGSITDDGLARLARSPALAELRTLCVASPAITEAGLAQLLAAPWPLLEWFYVAEATIADAAALAVDRPALELDLYRCAIEPEVVAELTRSWGLRLRCTR